VARLLALIAKLQVVTCVIVPLAGGVPESVPPSLPVLLARHVPILVLHPDERFGPVRVDGFLADSDLQRKSASGWETIAGPLPSGGADLRLDQRSCRAIDGLAASPCYATAEAAHGSEPVVYGKAFRTKAGIDLQYWIWYPFNPYSPTVPPGELWQVHEGDWEAVSVITDARGKPLAAGYSQHGEGKQRAWARIPKRGLRPLVYVALGSHANHFSPGVHRLDPRVIEPLLIAIIEQSGIRPVEHTGTGRNVRPRLVRVTGTTPQWMTFAGTWGEDQFLRTPGGLPQAFGGGPRGPAFHELWRQPVIEARSWPRG
jgi:hypothetical protein